MNGPLDDGHNPLHIDVDGLIEHIHGPVGFEEENLMYGLLGFVQMLNDSDDDFDDLPLAEMMMHDEQDQTDDLSDDSSLEEDEDFVDVESANGMIQEDGPHYDWSILSPLIVVDIMKYLPDGDRASMAVACKQWNLIHSSACLWRCRTLRFCGSALRAKQESKKAIGFAAAHGRHLRRLSVYCEHPSYSMCKVFQTAMKDFLGSLLWRHASLKRFAMRRMFIERYWRFDNVREKLVGSLSRFFRRQAQLEYVDLSDGHWPLTNGLKLLDSLSRGCKGNRRFTYLNLEDFFQTRLSVFRLERYQNIMTKFKALTSLYTNYNSLSENVILTLADSGTLKLLSIKVYRHEPHAHAISTHAWRQATRKCRGLQVEIYCEGLGKYEDLAVILQKGMPAQTIQVWTGLHPVDQEWRLSRLLTLLGSNFANVLEECYLSLETEEETIDVALLEMLGKCKRLETFELQAKLTLDTVESIYQNHCDGKINLFKCHISISNLTQVETVRLEDINTKWASMVEERNLDFEIEANEIVLF